MLLYELNWNMDECAHVHPVNGNEHTHTCRTDAVDNNKTVSSNNTIKEKDVIVDNDELTLIHSINVQQKFSKRKGLSHLALFLLLESKHLLYDAPLSIKSVILESQMFQIVIDEISLSSFQL